MNNISIACIQSASDGVTTPSHVDDVLRNTNSRVDLAVLPELCTVPYFPLEPDSLDAESPITIDGPELADFGEVARAHKCHLMIGVHLSDGERRFNAAILLGEEGKPLVGRTNKKAAARSYHKVHLCDVNLPHSIFCESSYFEAGAGYVVWDLPFGCIGVLICYDRHFPEAWVALREMGAEIICVCTTSPLSAESYFISEIQGMAVQQSVYAAVANRVGHQVLRTSGRHAEFLGSSFIVGPVGEVLAVAPARENLPMVRAELSAQGLEDIRVAHQFHEHRRPETYVECQR